MNDRIKNLVAFLENYKQFKSDLEDQLVSAKFKVDSYMEQGFISESGLNKLNHDLGFKAGLQRIATIIKSYEEEVEEAKDSRISTASR